MTALVGTRDLVAIDQRGTGASHPNLACPELDAASSDSEALGAVSSCRSRLAGAGANLAAFRTITNADDVEAVRVASGYPAWNLLGVSHGTRLALTVLREHPEGVRVAVLSSVVALEADFLGDVPSSAERSFTHLYDASSLP